MEFQYKYASAYKNYHHFGACTVIVVESKFLDNPMKFPVAGISFIDAQKYAHMTCLLTIARQMIKQRHNNYSRTQYYVNHSSNIAKGLSLCDKLFMMKQKIEFDRFVFVYKSFLMPVLHSLSPKTDCSPFFRGYIEKLDYLNYLVKINPNKLS